MPKSDNQKLKIFYILDYLEAHSNEKNPVRASDLIAMLDRQHNIRCDRKTVYSDIAALQQYGVDTCLYGHLHSYAMHNSLKGEHWGIDFHLVSADYLGFMPKLICEL